MLHPCAVGGVASLYMWNYAIRFKEPAPPLQRATRFAASHHIAPNVLRTFVGSSSPMIAVEKDGMRKIQMASSQVLINMEREAMNTATGV